MQAVEDVDDSRIEAAMLERFGSDLWLERRLQVSDMLHHLNSLATSGPAAHVEAGPVVGWRRFLELLAQQCTGAQFNSDKQWRQLMCHMGVSRKLNHRSARVRDLIKCRRVIEANAGKIAALNASARSQEALRVSLGSLEAKVLASSLQMASSPALADVSRALSATREQLRHQCRRQAALIRAQLDREVARCAHSSSTPELDQWRSRLDSLDKQLANQDAVLSAAIELASRMRRLGTLTSWKDGEPSNEGCHTRAQQQTGVDSAKDRLKDALGRCVSEARRLSEIYGRLVVSRVSSQSQPALATAPKLDKLVRELASELERARKDAAGCESELDTVMQTLRLEFSRFYFISDAELLQVIALDTRLISDASVAADCQRIIRKLFNESISRFELTADCGSICGVWSPFGELCALAGPQLEVPLRKRANVYSLELVRVLNELLRKLAASLRSQLGYSLANHNDLTDSGPTPEPCAHWQLPVQLLDVAERVQFCARVEARLNQAGCGADAFNTSSKRLLELMHFYELQLAGQQWKSSSLKQHSSELDVLKRACLSSLNVHFVSVLAQLTACEDPQAAQWVWRKHVRHYSQLTSTGSGKLLVCLGEAQFDYKFDYVACLEPCGDQSSDQPGISGWRYKRLMSTKATERCMLAASHARAKLRMGANPFGPAGAGKTECIKALARLLGRQLVVHNCDPSNEPEAVERLIWGLAHAGLWGCLDELNRLSASALSTAATCLEQVQRALRAQTDAIDRDGQTRRVEPDCAYFVTLNPAQVARYGGRRRLPANLRSLFAPIAMARSDLAPIVTETLLTLAAAAGRPMAGNMARELGHTFALWAQEASQRLVGASDRCEWDLRLVMGVMRRVALLLATSGSPDLGSQLAQAIWLELSPRLGPLQSSGDERKILQDTIVASFSCKPSQLSQQELSQQLEGQLQTRSGVLLLGPPGSGKSQTWRKLASRQHVTWLALNPSSLSTGQSLLGSLSPDGVSWSDGLLTILVRKALAHLQTNNGCNQVWIVLDGPLSPEWLEALNSVLDDNQTLTLGSGERLTFAVPGGGSIKLLFETDSVRLVSPASVSRLGLVCVSAPYDEQAGLQDHNQTKVDFCIVLTPSASLRHKALLEAMSQPDEQSVYRCSRHTNATHILEWLDQLSAPSTPLAVANLDLIQADTSWGAKTAIELLRHLAEYRSYYSRESELVDFSRPLVCSASSREALFDQRLVGKASRVIEPACEEVSHSEPLKLQPTPILSDADTSWTWLDSVEQSVHVLVAEEPDEARRKLATYLSLDRDRGRVVQARSDREAQESMRVIRDFSIGAMSLAEQSSQQQHERLVLILDQFEADLMSVESRADLYHALNWIRSGSAGVRVVFLCHKDSLAELELWQSFGVCWQLNGLDCGQLDSEECRSMLSLISKQGWPAPVEPRWKRAWLESWRDMRSKLGTELETRSSLLGSGLAALDELGPAVHEAKAQSESEGFRLAKQRADIERLMAENQLALAEAQSKRRKLLELKQQHSEASVELTSKSKLIESKLATVRIQVEANKAELERQLGSDALSEIRALRAPPATIKDILDVLFALLGAPGTSGPGTELTWPAMKSALAGKWLRERLASFEPRSLNAQLVRRARGLIELKRASFEPQQVARASGACVPIVAWIESALRFGQVLAELEPLERELATIGARAGELEVAAGELTRELSSTEERLSVESERVGALRSELSAAELRALAADERLSRAENAVERLRLQSESWRQRQLTARQLLAEDQLGLRSLALALCSLAWLGPSRAQLNAPRLAALGLKSQLASSESQLLELALDVLQPLDSSHAGSSQLLSLDHSGGQAERGGLSRAQLVALRVCAYHAPPSSLVGFVELGERAPLPAELCQLLSRDSILCSPEQLELARWEDARAAPGEWARALERVRGEPDRLLVVELGQAASSCHQRLELAEFVARGPSEGLKMLLAGQLAQHGHLKAWVHVAADLTESTAAAPGLTPGQLQATLVSLREPELSGQQERLEAQVRLKRRQTTSAELQLLTQLALTRTANTEVAERALAALASLQQLENEAQADLEDARGRAAHLSSLAEPLRELAKAGADFYTKHLAELDKRDAFYRVSVGRYANWLSAALNTRPTSPSTTTTTTTTTTTLSQPVRLVAPNWQQQQQQRKPTNAAVGNPGGKATPCAGSSRNPGATELLSADAIELALATVASQVTRSLRAQDRRHFVEKLGPGCNNIGSATHPGASELDRELGEALRDTSSSMLLVEHDADRPSPQARLDELARAHERNHDLVYLSLAAGAPSAAPVACGQPLERALERAASSAPNGRLCLCLANAHLASGWLNAHLAVAWRQLAQLRPDLVVTLVLVCERLPGGPEVLDVHLLELVKRRLWHDELSANLAHRYHRLLAAHSTAGDQLEQQVILLHVVFQELQQQQQPQRRPHWKQANLAFDSDQLALALELCKSLGPAPPASGGEDQRREMLAKYLVEVVYGCRLELESDERLLSALVRRFVSPAAAASSSFARASQLLAEFAELGSTAAGQRLSSLLAELIGDPL